MADARTRAMLRAYGIEAQRLEAPFALWLVRPLDGSQERLASLLGEAERLRAARFAVDALARRYRAAHGALRLLVEERFGIPAARQVYAAGAYGKPSLPEAPHVQCNISYSAGHALVALETGTCSGGGIGIDIERVRPIADAADLARLYYTAREIEELGRCSPAEIDHAFLTVWVRKEACSKTLGKGLAIAPSSFDCGVGCGRRSVHVDGEVVESGVVESEIVDPKGGFLISWAFSRS